MIFIESLSLYDTKGDVPEDDPYTLPIGLAEVKRQGSDVTVVAYSRMTPIALQVAQLLEREGISVEVVDLRSLRPLDRPTIINSVKKTNRAITMEGSWRSYGIGAEVAAAIQEEAFDYLDAPVQRVAGLEVPLPYALNLSQASKPGAQDLKNAIYRTLEGGKRWQK